MNRATGTSYRTNIRRSGLGLLAAAVFAICFPHAGVAQDSGPWQAFFGCWTPAGFEVDSAPEGDRATEVVCFSPSGNGAELLSVIDGDVASRELLIADGEERIVEADACTGARSVRFSADRRRVFTRSAIQCPDDERSGTGVMAFVSPTTWVDVRSLELAGESVVWAVEYRPVARTWYGENGIRDAAADNAGAVRDMRRVWAQPIGNADVMEALDQIDASAVSRWVAVNPVAFDLDGDQIVRLADEGVPESLIDVMVARSFPDRFSLSIEGEATITETGRRPVAGPSRVLPSSYSTFYGGVHRSYLFDPFFYPYGFGYGYYDPFGYPYYTSGFNRGRPYYYRGGSVIVVEPSEPESQGRMVNGQGYRRNTPRSAVDAGSQGSTGSAATAATGVSAGTQSSGGTQTSGGTESGGRMSPAGASSSGSSGTGSSEGTASPRRARPRN